jgi:lipid A 1-phosphatase
VSLRTVAKQAYTEVEQPSWFRLACIIGIVISLLFPTNLKSYRTAPPDRSTVAVVTEDYGRFAVTAAQVAMPLVTRDAVGLVQLAYVALGTTALTHTIKFLVQDVTVWEARLGERPSRAGSRNNMPSGHASMASCAVYYLGRRYGWWHLLYAVPIMLLTMYARVALQAHTVSAVIAGMLVGLLMAAMFTGKRHVAAAA